MLHDDQIKSLLIITLCPCFELLEKKITKVSVIDHLNEQHIVIIEESHDWPNILLSGHTVYISFSTYAYIHETGRIRIIGNLAFKQLMTRL